MGEQAVGDLLHNGLVKGLQGGAGHPAPAHHALGEHRGVRIVPVGIEQGFGVLIGRLEHLVTASQIQGIRQPGSQWVIGLFKQHAQFGLRAGRLDGHTQQCRQGVGRCIDHGQPAAAAVHKCFQFPVVIPFCGPQRNHDCVVAQIRGQRR